METLEAAFDRLHADGRPRAAVAFGVIETVHAILRGDYAADPEGARAAAADVVRDGLALLHRAGGLPGDVDASVVRALGGPVGVVSGGAAAERPHRRRFVGPASLDDTTADPDPHLGPAAGPGRADADTGRYPDGPAGDRLAFLDLEHADDD